MGEYADAYIDQYIDGWSNDRPRLRDPKPVRCKCCGAGGVHFNMKGHLIDSQTNKPHRCPMPSKAPQLDCS